MIIVHVLFNLRTGGTETMLIDIMNRQKEVGHEVHLMLINAGHQEELLDNLTSGVGVHRLNRPVGSKNPLWLLRYNRALSALRPDVVHVHNKQALGMLYGPRRYKVVFTYHCNGDVNRYAGRADLLCAISQAVAADVRGRGEGEPVVVYNGIDTSAVPRRDSSRPLGSPVRVVQIGSLKHMVKGQHIALRALSAMKHSDVSFDFYGEGASRPMLESLARELGVDSRVRFLGNRSRHELYGSLPSYDIAMLPSLDEGFGLALVEPMAAGIPVVCSALAGPLEVLAAAGTGVSAGVGDAEALAAALDGIIDNYGQHLAEAAHAVGAIASDFDIRSTAGRYLEIYRSLNSF